MAIPVLKPNVIRKTIPKNCVPRSQNYPQFQELYQKFFPSCAMKCRRRSEKFRQVPNVQFRGHVGCRLPDKNANDDRTRNAGHKCRRAGKHSDSDQENIRRVSTLEFAVMTELVQVDAREYRLPGEMSTMIGKLFLQSECPISRSCRRLTCRMYA